MKENRIKYILIGIIGTLFIIWQLPKIIYSWQNPPPSDEQLQQADDQMKADMQNTKANILNDLIGMVDDSCSGDGINSNNCGKAIQNCLNNIDCLQMIHNYEVRNKIANTERLSVLHAVQEYNNEQLQKMGLPTLEPQ